METLFKLANCEEFGDYMVSEQNFAEGETVYKEEPLLSCPLESGKEGESEFCCMSCFKTLQSQSMTCSKCHFPVCSFSCSQDKLHNELECKLFTEKKIRPSKRIFGFLKFLRVFLSKDVFPERFNKFLQLSSEFGPGIVRFSSSMEEESKVAYKFLTKKCQMPVALAEVTKIWTAFKINGFLIMTEDESGNTYRGHAVFEIGSKFNHSCSANMQWFFEKTEKDNGISEWHLLLRSTRKIKKGDILSIAYAPVGLDYGTGKRRGTYQTALPFDCLCSRCVDATEEGTFFSSSKCSNCNIGYLLPEDPLSSFTCLWKCTTCVGVKNGVDIQNKVNRDERKINRLMSASTAASLEKLDAFIEKKSGKTLHPNHYLIFQASNHWLSRSSFTRILIENSEKSADLFDKIVTRSSRCIRLATKFLPTMTIVELEIIVMNAVAAFAFKCSPGGSAINLFDDCYLNLRYGKMLLKHLTGARFWFQKLPNCQCLKEHKNSLEELFFLWTHLCDGFQQDVLSFQMKMEDVALFKLCDLFI